MIYARSFSFIRPGYRAAAPCQDQCDKQKQHRKQYQPAFFTDSYVSFRFHGLKHITKKSVPVTLMMPGRTFYCLLSYVRSLHLPD